MGTPKYIAGYIRVSSGKQVKEGESLPEQRRMVEEYARIHNFTVYKIYSDEGISGSISDRPALEDLKRDADQRRFGKIIFYSLDRFGRSAKDLLNNYEFFEKRGISLLSLRENIDTSTPTGRFLRTILGAVAELEREMIRERVVTGMAARIRKGRKPVGRVPFGFTWDKITGEFMVKPEEAKVYKEMIDLFLVKKKSMIQVAGISNQQGYRTKEGKKFTQPSVREILKNSFYKGEWTVGFQGQKYDYNPPALVDRTTWNKIQTQIQDNRLKPRNFSKEDKFLLRGLIFCGECGSMLSCSSYKSNTKWPMRYYKCLTSKATKGIRLASNPHKSCSLPYINSEDVENYVFGSILNYFQFPENLIARWKENIDLSSKVELEHDLQGFKIKLGKRESERKKLLDLYVSGRMDRDLLDQKDLELKGEISSLKEKMEDIQKQLDNIEIAQQQLGWLTDVGKDLKKLRSEINEALTKMTLRQQKEFIAEALAGNKLTVRILTRRDFIDSSKGLSKEELNEPVYNYKGRSKTVTGMGG